MTIYPIYNGQYISYLYRTKNIYNSESKTQQIDIMQNNSLLSLKTNNENTSSIHKNDP